MPALTRHRFKERRYQKITLREMRTSGVRGLLVYCSDYHRSHWVISADQWPDDVRLSDIEAKFTARPATGAALMSGRIGNRSTHMPEGWRVMPAFRRKQANTWPRRTTTSGPWPIIPFPED
jgi:hypothetical protein